MDRAAGMATATGALTTAPLCSGPRQRGSAASLRAPARLSTSCSSSSCCSFAQVWADHLRGSVPRGRCHAISRPRPSDGSHQAPGLPSCRMHSLPFPEGVLLGEPLSKYCSWGIGGPAKYLVYVKDLTGLTRALRWAKDCQQAVMVLGKGSNCLFDDRGFDGLVIVNQLDHISDNGDGRFSVGSGFQFNKLGVWAASCGWGGLEFAVGIPGTVGGAAYMNAGSDGQEASSVIVAASVVHSDGSTEELSLHAGTLRQSQFGYRQSPFQDLPPTSIITSVTFQLTRDPHAYGKAMAGLKRRKENQPLHLRTAGCVFRNPVALPTQQILSAGQLIDQAGLKGTSIGGATVSTLHANFLTNQSNAKSSDMRRLIELVKQRVADETGVVLEEEIRYIPHSPAVSPAVWR